MQLGALALIWDGQGEVFELLDHTRYMTALHASALARELPCDMPDSLTRLSEW